MMRSAVFVSKEFVQAFYVYKCSCFAESLWKVLLLFAPSEVSVYRAGELRSENVSDLNGQ